MEALDGAEPDDQRIMWALDDKAADLLELAVFGKPTVHVPGLVRLCRSGSPTLPSKWSLGYQAATSLLYGNSLVGVALDAAEEALGSLQEARTDLLPIEEFRRLAAAGVAAVDRPALREGAAKAQKAFVFSAKGASAAADHVGALARCLEGILKYAAVLGITQGDGADATLERCRAAALRPLCALPPSPEAVVEAVREALRAR